MAGAFAGTGISLIGADIVEAKLALVEEHILLHNKKMVVEMLTYVKEAVEPQIPIGPGHFGYHLRNTFRVDVSIRGLQVVGVLKAARQGWWRERGTRRGERAYMTAHHALAGIKRFIRAYYGGLAPWWNA